ncbi:metal ABC transporter substrate-binding protein [Actinomadura rayongensis]|uniref:Zinc ABC transporter solute-binding protein n=1 Tax=Actinomadura rayongensis TaxID=1429076 RepID=A0A6I4VZH2_9ACTN|nr:metal ABC transporter substrate-binding protein [Actinomadura rayongensis]MXQ63739.1 zinc ABC transporter solute-binding protein [Actinomadura rayongensis]
MPAFRSRPAVLAAALALAAAGLTACGDGGTGGRADVLASFYPMAFLASRVGGPDVQVSTLTRPGAEPHDLELTPKQIGHVKKARLTVYVNGLQPAVDDAVRHQAGHRALDAGALVPLLPATEGPGTDPHLWLDPSRMAVLATALGDRLANTDPAHAAAYRERARTLAGQLTALDAAFKAGLRKCARTTIVTAHAAFGYLAARYGLRQVPVAGVDPSAEPSPRRLADLAALVRETGATTVFTETLASPKVAAALARAAGARTAVLDPLEGIRKGSGDDYLSVMRTNLTVLRAALGCP